MPLGALGGSSLQMSNSASSRADSKAAQGGSLGSFGPRGNSFGTIGGIGSGGPSMTTLLAIGAVVLAGVWFMVKR